MMSTIPSTVQSMMSRTMPRMMRKAPIVTALSVPRGADAQNVRPWAFPYSLEPRYVSVPE
jgi:hypothetical protein